MANNFPAGGEIPSPNDSGSYPDDGRPSVNNQSYGVGTPGKTIALATGVALVLLAIATVAWFVVLKPLVHGDGEKPVEVQSSRKAFDLEARAAPKPVEADCPKVTLTQTNGSPLIGVDGKPITVDCKGNASSRVPAPGAGLYQGAASAAPQDKPKPNPYRGGVILKDATTAAPSIGMPQMPKMPDLSALQNLIKTRAPGAGGGLFQGGEGGGEGGGPAPRNVRGAVGGMLGATTTGDTKAGQLKRMPLLLPKGRQIDCALTTRIVSEVSGFASCVLTSNVYSVDGKTLLLERGSEVDGEYQAGMRRGQRRLFVLWNRVRTPNGVFVNLASPNADALGTMGLPGYVDNKWFERIGSAFLLSIVQDAISNATDSGGTVQREFDPNGNVIRETDSRRWTRTENAADKSVEMLLADQLGIQPTLYANQGDRVSIYVARDVNFEDVYARR